RYFFSGNPSPPIDTLRIDIKYKAFQKIVYKRENALKKGFLEKGPDDFVSAGITWNNKNFRTDLRLKGDFPDHWAGEKWSYRVKVKDGQSIRGMRVFSLQDPSVRHGIMEWIYQKALAEEGVIALRYSFVYVFQNGKPMGIYAMEEHFDRNLIENRKYREGPVMRFLEDYRWRDQSYFKAEIDAFRSEKVRKDSSMYRLFRKGAALLEAFRRKEASVGEVFNTEALAKYYAISDIFGAQHAYITTNMRFYFNPVTEKFLPIGFDGNAGFRIYSTFYERNSHLSVLFNSDSLLISLYNKALNEYTEPGWLEGFLDSIKEEKVSAEKALASDAEGNHNFSSSAFEANRDFLRRIIRPYKGLLAFTDSAAGGRLYFSVANAARTPLYIDSAVCRGGGKSIPFSEYLPHGEFSKPAEYIPLSIPAPCSSASIYYHLSGIPEVRSVFVSERSYYNRQLAKSLTDKRKERIPDELKTDSDLRSGNIRVLPGKSRLSDTLIFGKGKTVFLEPGAELIIGSSASVISYSPLISRGTEESPVIIKSLPGVKGKMIISGTAQDSSVFNNTVFIGTGLTVYESSVGFRRCSFLDSRGEDAVNIIRSDFLLSDCRFQRIFSDALDSDFSRGSVLNTAFSNVGNDALDFSGSNAELRDVRVDGCGDKGLSAGERSRIDISSSDLKNCFIGIATKDLSSVYVGAVELNGCVYNYAVYQKKSEYGGGNLYLDSASAGTEPQKCVLERGSFISPDNTACTEYPGALVKKLYPEE
ncbi:MAG: CotH kinase family protein, partial [Fibrobacterota bacterium]